MGTSPHERPNDQPDLSIQLASLAHPKKALPSSLAKPINSRPSYGIQGSRFVQYFSEPHAKKVNQTQVFEKYRASAPEFVRFLLGRLATAEDQEWDELITSGSKKFKTLSTQERSQIGATIPADAPIRQAYTELDDAISEFHGSIYDGELRYTRDLVFFMIESAMQDLNSAEATPLESTG